VIEMEDSSCKATGTAVRMSVVCGTKQVSGICLEERKAYGTERHMQGRSDSGVHFTLADVLCGTKRNEDEHRFTCVGWVIAPDLFTDGF